MTASVSPEEFALLRAQVDYLLERLADADGLGASPVCWTALDREQARGEWAALAGWVDWLVDRYGLTERVPGCWYRHPPLLEELSALRCAWLGAYESPAARPADGVYWHDALDRVLARLAEWDRCGCVRGVHRDDIPVAGDGTVLAERARHIRADVDTRPAANEPGPDTPTLL